MRFLPVGKMALDSVLPTSCGLWNCTAARSRSRANRGRERGCTSICAEMPVPAANPGTRIPKLRYCLLPNRHFLLQLVDDELRRGKRFAAMRRLHPNQQRRFADGDHAKPVDDPDSLQRPLSMSLGK